MLQEQRTRVEEKRERLCEQLKHVVSYKQLVLRNQREPPQNATAVRLPFILVCTRDSPDNEVEFFFGEDGKNLSIAMKQQMRCVGDADVLLRLGFCRATQDWLRTQEPALLSAFESLSPS